MKNKLPLLLCLLIALFTKTAFAQLSLPYVFENNSRYADEEIYIGLVGKTQALSDVWMDMSTSTLQKMSADDNTIPGPEWSFPREWLYPEIFTKLSDIDNSTIQIPHGLFGCRIFISFESPMYLHFHETGGYAGANLNNPGDPNTGIRWEIVELTWGDAGLWTNTSRVDAYQYPMALEVNGYFGGIEPNLTYEQLYNAALNGTSSATNHGLKKVGEVLSHDAILAAWDNTVSTPYLEAKVVKPNSIDGEPIIEQPSKVDEFPKDLLDDYIDDIWETYKEYDLVINIGDRGIWRGRVESDGTFNFIDPADGSIATIYGKPTTVGALEGSDTLAFTPVSVNENLAKNNEDLMIQAQISAAITRHAIYTDITDDSVQNTHDAERFFVNQPYNEYVSFFHSEAISFESQTYAFAYDDVGDHSSTIQSTFPQNVKVIIGGYAEERAPAELKEIQVSPLESTVQVGEEIQFTAQALDQYGDAFETDITWTTFGEEITQNGVFRATQTGTYGITATSGEFTGVATITVRDAPSELTSIVISPESSTILVGEELQLNVQAFDQYGDTFETDITWSTNGGTITQNGVFRATQTGTYGITASSGNFEATTAVNVSDLPAQLTSIVISPDMETIQTGEQIQFSAQAYDQYGEVFTANINWYTSDNSISENGLFSATKEGTYTITAVSGSIENSTIINVSSLLAVSDIETDIADLPFRVFPNPTNGNDLNLIGLEGVTDITIYDVFGRLVMNKKTKDVTTTHMETKRLQSGFYFMIVSMQSEDKEITRNIKVIVN